jgi:hypothetical protein
VALDVAPSDAGLVLTSTIVGPARRVARISGKTYREGDSIPTTLEDKTLEYKVVSIGGKSVTLALGEQQYELKMARDRSGATAALSVSVSSDSPDFDPAILE